MYFKVLKTTELGKKLQNCMDISDKGRIKSLEVMKLYGAAGYVTHETWGGLTALVFPEDADVSKFKKYGKANDGRQMYIPKVKEKGIRLEFALVEKVTRQEWCDICGLPWRYSAGFMNSDSDYFGLSIRESWIDEFKKSDDMIEITYTEFNSLKIEEENE